MTIDVAISAAQVQPLQVRGKLVVVIDVLRASSVICTGLYHGATEFIPMNKVSKAIRYAHLKHNTFKTESVVVENDTKYHNDWANLLHINKNIQPERTYKKNERRLLAGEQNGFKINDFDLGNSPLEYTAEVVKDKTIVIITTNGTHAIKNSAAAHELIIACFLNIDKVCEYIQEQEHDVVVVCAGTLDQFSLDDALCAGNIIANLVAKDKEIELTDAAFAHKTLYESVENKDLKAVLKEGCQHYTYLENNGFSEDLDYCLRKNSCPVVPKFFRYIIAL